MEVKMKKLIIIFFISVMLITTAFAGSVYASEEASSRALSEESSGISGIAADSVNDEASEDIPEAEEPCKTELIVSLEGKTVMMVGNSMLYYGNCVIYGNQGKRDEGYLHQLISSNGENATVLDYTYPGKTIKYIYTNHLKSISPAELEKVDYVVLAEANKSNNDLLSDCNKIRALFPEKTEFVFVCHPKMYYSQLETLLSGVEALRKKDITFVDWGRMVYDIFSGRVSVPGSSLKYDICTFIKDNTFVKDAGGNLIENPYGGDNIHPNPLSGYICAQMVYSAITNRSALYTDYSFCYDACINSNFDIDYFALKHYTGNKTTNFTDVFRSPSEMHGIQSLIDSYLSQEGKHLIRILPSVDPGCTTGGLTQGYFCSVCDEIVREQEYISSKGGHKVAYTKAVAPTCTKAGKTGSAYCAVCSETLIKAASLGATGHSDTVAVKAATTHSDGRRTVSCTVCKTTVSDVKIPKIAEITLSKSTYTYDGKRKKPKVTVKNSEGKLLVADKDYSVAYPSGRREIGNYTVTVEFKGRYSGTQKLTFKIRPGVTVGVNTKSYENSVKLTWKKVEGATGYRVYLYNPKNKKYEVYAETKKASLTVKKLKTATEYKFRVKAYTDNGKKRYLSDGFAYTVTATKPGEAELLSAANVRRGEVTLKWAKVRRADGYRIFYSTDSDFRSSEKLTVKGGNTVTETVKNLKSGKKYYFKVRAFKTVGKKKVYGDFSKVRNSYVR